MLFNNAQACMSWLTYLQRTCGAEALIGKDLSRVAEQAWLYNCAGDMLIFGGEVPLLGTAALDLSCQYEMLLFAKGNAFANHELEEQGMLFTEYAQKLQQLVGERINSMCMFLEADTSKERQRQLSVFYNMENDYYRTLLPAVLRAENYPEMTEMVQKVVQLLYPSATLWQVGCMQGRAGRPVRLVLSLQRGGLAKALECLAVSQRECIVEQVNQVLAGDLFVEDSLDLDVFPDGSIGHVIGVEATLKRCYQRRQLAAVRQPAYAHFKQKLQEYGMADERIDLVDRCVLAMQAPDKWQAPYYIYSGVSHFKMQWRAGEILPAKAYLALMPTNLPTTVNEFVGTVQSLR